MMNLFFYDNFIYYEIWQHYRQNLDVVKNYYDDDYKGYKFWRSLC